MATMGMALNELPPLLRVYSMTNPKDCLPNFIMWCHAHEVTHSTPSSKLNVLNVSKGSLGCAPIERSGRTFIQLFVVSTFATLAGI